MKQTENPFEETPLDLSAFYAKVKSRWWYFLIALIVFTGLSFMAIRYMRANYRIGTTLILRDDKNSSLGAENLLDGLELFAGKKNLENEIGMLRSYQMIHKTILQSDFEVSYYTKAWIKSVERYRDMPFRVEIDTTVEQLAGVPFFVEVLSSDKCLITAHAENAELYSFADNVSNKRYKSSEFDIHDTVYFGKPYVRFGAGFTMYYQIPSEGAIPGNDEMYFVINDLNKLTESYRKDLIVQSINSEASILMLQLERSSVEKEMTFLNNLSRVYISSGLEEKNEIAINTIAFIDSELSLVNDTLKDSEADLQVYRTEAGLVDLGMESQTSLTAMRDLENEYAQGSVKLKYYDYLNENLQKNNLADNLITPATMGIEDPLLNSLVNDLRKLYSEQIALQQSATPNNPYVAVREAQIENLKKTLQENVKSLLESAKYSLAETRRRMQSIGSSTSNIPEKQRQLIGFERRFNLSSAIFNYLMQKRSEAQIAKASNTADSRILDPARLLDENPVFPKKLYFYAIALFLSLVVPLIIIVIQEALSDTVKDRRQIENEEIPVLGMTGHNFYRSKLPVNDYPRSAIAESIRLVKLNLQYLAPNKSNKIIGVTSTISGEGKTFCSVNLALSLSMSGQRTLVIGADLRKPRLHESFGISNEHGLSNYLIQEDDVDKIIQQTRVTNLDMIASGPTPPNPFELLSLPAMGKLLDECSERYDYIIVDTPPIGFVADYFAIAKHIDATVFIVRFRYTKVKFLADLLRMKKTARVENLYILLNDYRDYSSPQGYYGKSKNSNYYADNGKRSFGERVRAMFN
ncbi:MAG: polysaccharide biosynthesis tyrosine autokinase [Flavobacteriales bacterium]